MATLYFVDRRLAALIGVLVRRRLFARGGGATGKLQSKSCESRDGSKRHRPPPSS